MERTEVTDKKAAATKKVSPPTERNKNYIYPKHN